MRIVHQLNLPRNAWDDFINRLTHHDAVKQAKVNAFLKEIDQNINITHEPNKTIVESHRLNETAILAALQNGNSCTTTEVHSETYDIQVNGFIDFDDLIGFVDQIAQEDFYQTRLLASERKTSEYITTNVDNRTRALAA